MRSRRTVGSEEPADIGQRPRRPEEEDRVALTEYIVSGGRGAHGRIVSLDGHHRHAAVAQPACRESR
ncbi:MAG: hypothetical protein M3125_03175, partial [Gemmatimonadota bacterium]|nr:hypothetical protein [Gemmatimonadota bacterium]